MPVNLRQLAQLLGLSITTVSRALADYPDVSPATRRRVRKAAAEHGYRPNPVARRLQRGKTEAIGIVLPPGQAFFRNFLQLLAGVSERLSETEYDLTITVASSAEQEMQALRRMVEERRVDGLVMVQSKQEDPRIEFLLKSGFPFVVYGRTHAQRPYAFVDMDGIKVFREACEHLASLGHRRIGLLNTPSGLNFSQYCTQGYREGLLNRGLPWDDSLIRERSGEALEEEESFRQTKELLALPNPPTAMLCFTEVATSVLQAMRDSGLKVGSQVSVIGYDDLDVAQYTTPPLTTMAPPVHDVGQRLVGVLLEIIGGVAPEQFQELWDAPLVHRQSTAPTSSGEG